MEVKNKEILLKQYWVS